MDTNGWLVLGASAAWPVVLLVGLLALLFTQRGPVGRLIDRMKIASVRGGDAEIDEQRRAIETLLAKVAEPPAQAFLSESPQEWQQTVAELVRQSAQLGWRLTGKGLTAPPEPSVEWRDDGPRLKVER